MNEQNACLMVTTKDEEGKDCVNYIPLSIGMDVVQFFFDNGSNCENKEAVWFKLDCDEKTFWTDMWNELMGR